MTSIIEVENKMITLRTQQVILDSDVAELYGVETKRVNEAVSNNPEKFPKGYVWELSEEEVPALRSKISTLKKAGRGQHSKYPPKAFTEKGLYMLATILKSPKAVETTIAIVEAYAKLRTLLQRGGQLVEDLMTDVLPVQSSETSFELNLAMLKFKHSVKRGVDEERVVRLEEENAELKRRLGEKSD